MWIDWAVLEDVIAVDAAAEKQRFGTDPGRTGYIGATRIADPQHRRRVIEAQFLQATLIDAGMGLTEIDHLATQFLIPDGQGAGADFRDIAAMHHEIGIDAEQWDALPGR